MRSSLLATGTKTPVAAAGAPGSTAATSSAGAGTVVSQPAATWLSSVTTTAWLWEASSVTSAEIMVVTPMLSARGRTRRSRATPW